MAHAILVPPLGQTTDTVILSTWYKRAGDAVKVGEPLFAIETDKATLDIEAQDGGILAQVNAQAGEEVKVLSSIGLIAAPGEAVEASPVAEAPEGKGAKGSEDTVAREVQSQAATVAPPQPQVSHLAPQRQQPAVAVAPQEPTLPVARAEGERVFISPRARRLAQAENIRWQHIAGSGPEGAILERDVQQYLAQLSRSPQPSPAAVTYPLNPAQAAQTLVAQADVSALVTLCGRYARREISVSLEAILVYILGQVARTMLEDGVGPADVSIGYVTPGQNGFVMPVLKDLPAKGLVSLTRKISEVAGRAQAGGLQPAELGEPAFGFCSLAAFGMDLFTPVVETPGVPLLGVGRARQGQSGERLAWFSLNYAGTRLGALGAARLLQQIVARIEDPDLLF
jgi:pyruvate dehydrogenase E2 component (dihydrolipoamide acetyltransferase)